MSSFVLLRFAVYVDGTMATFFWPCSSRLPAGRGHTERSVFDFLGENFVIFANFRGGNRDCSTFGGLGDEFLAGG